MHEKHTNPPEENAKVAVEKQDRPIQRTESVVDAFSKKSVETPKEARRE